MLFLTSLVVVYASQVSTGLSVVLPEWRPRVREIRGARRSGIALEGWLVKFDNTQIIPWNFPLDLIVSGKAFSHKRSLWLDIVLLLNNLTQIPFCNCAILTKLGQFTLMSQPIKCTILTKMFHILGEHKSHGEGKQKCPTRLSMKPCACRDKKNGLDIVCEKVTINQLEAVTNEMKKHNRASKSEFNVSCQEGF